MDEHQRKERNIDSLPSSLENAIQLMEKSQLAKETLGDHIFSCLIANKKVEWDAYRMAVTNYELEKYLPFF